MASAEPPGGDLDSVAVICPFAGYWLLWVDTSWWVRVAALLAVVLVVRIPVVSRRLPAILLGVAGAHVAALAWEPTAWPNHHFVLTWVALAVGLNGRRGPAVGDAARWLYVALMFFAALQKLLSPTFRDGSFLAWLLLDGGLFHPVLTWVPGWDAVTAANRELVESSGYPPTLPERVLIGPVVGLEAWARSFAVVIVGVEGALCGLAAWRPRSLAFHALAAGFVILLPVVRPEWVFGATLALLTGLATDDRAVGWRRLYSGCAVAFPFAGLISHG